MRIKKRGQKKGPKPIVIENPNPFAPKNTRPIPLDRGPLMPPQLAWVCPNCPRHLAILIEAKTADGQTEKLVHLKGYIWDKSLEMFVLYANENNPLSLPQKQQEEILEIEESIDKARLGEEGAQRAFWQRLGSRLRVPKREVVKLSSLPKKVVCRCKTQSILFDARHLLPKNFQPLDARQEKPKNNENGFGEVLALPP